MAVPQSLSPAPGEVQMPLSSRFAAALLITRSAAFISSPTPALAAALFMQKE